MTSAAADGAMEPRKGPGFTSLGVWVDAVQIPQVIQEIKTWIQTRDRCRWIAVTGMHGLTEAQRNETFKSALNSADLVVPDGMPLVWLARRNGFNLKRRVYGPELMATFCEVTSDRYQHFLYGGGPGIAEKLAEELTSRFGSRVVGTFTPPFRELAPDESEKVVGTINTSGADVVWVGLSTPKQELWIHQHWERLTVPVAVGAGAAFDLLTGTKRMAPRWMQEHGLEWFFRLAQEPKRLWRRYLIGGARFVYYTGLEALGLKRF